MFAFAAMLSLGLPWRDWSLALHSPPLSLSRSRRDTCDLTQCQPRPRPHQREAWMSHTQRSTPAQNPHIHTSLGVSTATSTVRGKSQFPVLIIMRQFIYYPVPSYLNLDGWMHCIRVCSLIVWTVSFNGPFLDTYQNGYRSLFLPFNFGIVFHSEILQLLLEYSFKFVKHWGKVIPRRVKYPATNFQQEMMCDKLRPTDKVRYKSRFWENL